MYVKMLTSGVKTSAVFLAYIAPFTSMSLPNDFQ